MAGAQGSHGLEAGLSSSNSLLSSLRQIRILVEATASPYYDWGVNFAPISNALTGSLGRSTNITVSWSPCFGLSTSCCHSVPQILPL